MATYRARKARKPMPGYAAAVTAMLREWARLDAEAIRTGRRPATYSTRWRLLAEDAIVRMVEGFNATMDTLEGK